MDKTLTPLKPESLLDNIKSFDLMIHFYSLAIKITKYLKTNKNETYISLGFHCNNIEKCIIKLDDIKKELLATDKKRLELALEILYTVYKELKIELPDTKDQIWQKVVQIFKNKG